MKNENPTYLALERWAAELARQRHDDTPSVLFQVMAAAYAWCSLNHGGQWSPEYALLCAIDFNPEQSWSESRELEENEYAPETVEWLTAMENWQDES